MTTPTVRTVRRGFGGTVPSAAVLVVAAAVLAGKHGSVVLVAPLSFAAIVAVVAHGVAGRRQGPLDAFVAGLTALVLVLVALGFVLDQLPGGISTGSWSAAAAVAGLLVLLTYSLGRATPAADRAPRTAGPGRMRGAYGWYAVGLAGLAAALVIASRATTDATQPPLALSLTSATGSPDILVQAGTSTGRYELVIGDADSANVWQGPFTLTPHQQRRFAVDDATRGAPILTLRLAGSTTALRTLVTGY